MLKMIIPTAMLLPLTFISPCKCLWANNTPYILLIASISLQWLAPTWHTTEAKV